MLYEKYVTEPTEEIIIRILRQPWTRSIAEIAKNSDSTTKDVRWVRDREKVLREKYSFQIKKSRTYTGDEMESAIKLIKKIGVIATANKLAIPLSTVRTWARKEKRKSKGE